MNNFHPGLAGAVSLGLLSAAPIPSASAQGSSSLHPVVRLDAFETTREIWRGIRRNAQIVSQFDAALGLTQGSFSLSGGAWTMIEPASTRAEIRPDLRAGPAGPSEWDAWGQLSVHREHLDVATGVLRSRYVRPGPDPGVTELFGQVRLQSGRWVGGASLWHAWDQAHGTYLEPSVTFYNLANPFAGPAISLATWLRAGFQLSSRRPAPGTAIPGASGTGLTHVALGTTLRFGVNLKWSTALIFSIDPRVQYSRDPATRRSRDGSTGARFGFRIPVQAGVSLPLGRPE